MPVPAGMMRNKWFPFSVARYLTFDERRAVKRGEIEVMRDHGFEINAQRARSAAGPSAGKDSIDAAWQKYMGGDAPSAPEIEIKTIEVSSGLEDWTRY